MTTVGLELTSFIDPSLTWKTVSKGRNTSRRSRKSVSKNMKMVQEHEKRSPKQLNSLQCSESEKSKAIHGRRFPSNMEHIPIKKRRLLFRSSSPPLQSPNCHEKSEELVNGQCTSDQHTCSIVTTESHVVGSKSRNADFDSIIDENSVKSTSGARGRGEDFSGIAILAAAACSDRLDNSTDDTGKGQSQMDRHLDREQNESCVSVHDMNKSIPSMQSPDLHGKDLGHLEGVCVADLPKDSVQDVGVNNDADDVCMSPINESQNEKQIESVASTSVEKGSVEFRLPNSPRSDVVHVNKDSLTDLSNEATDKAAESSGSARGIRLHWDLNTIMDEWGNPMDDVGFDSSTQLVEVAPMNIMDPYNSEDREGSEGKRSEMLNLEDAEVLEAKRCEGTVSGDRATSQAEICVGPETVVLSANAGLMSAGSTFSRMGHCSEVSSGFVTNILKENSSPSNGNNQVVEAQMCVTKSDIQPKVVNENANIDHSLSLGSNGTKTSASEETNNGAGFEKANEVAEGTIPFSAKIVKSEEPEFGFLLEPFTGNASSEAKDADCKHMEDFEVTKVSDNKVANLGSSLCKSACADIFESGETSCQVNNQNCNNSEPTEPISLLDIKVEHEEVIVEPSGSLPSCFGNSVELKNSVVGLSSSTFENLGTSSQIMRDDQAMDCGVAEEIKGKPTSKDASENNSINNDGVEAHVPETLDQCVAIESLGGGHGSRVCNEDLNQVTENAGTVTESEGGYDSHLEDGELREPHCWEDNEGEDGETEHVDYDSDNRDGIVFYEANDSVQLSGEVLVGDSENLSCRPDNLSCADVQLNPDKSTEENCSQEFQGGLPKVDAMEAVCTKRESPVLKACSGAINDGKVEMDHKDCRSSIEADSIKKDLDNDHPRSASGASASGRNLQFPDRRFVDSMRRSRSSNFDGMHHSDGPDESLNRSQQPLLRMGRFGGRTWNPELKSIVANSATEDDGERALRGSRDSSPIRGRRPRIISTTRSGYHFVRRGSPGERDSDYGMGMMKGRDISPDNNPRNRFGRFNGMNRGFRDGYRRPGGYEGPKSGGGGPMLNRFGKRDRSFSPGGDRLYRKSRSRSRTHSPDFRSEARMGRGRMPYQQINHTAEHTRERRSPVRVFNQNQRFDAIGSPGRLRSDDCIRPPMRPMRFHDTTTSGRGHDFEESDDYRRKPPSMRNYRRSRSRSRSCSPEFRSDARMGSMRAPYQPSTDHIRDRRSPPVRVFRQDQRYEGGGSPARVRSDECMRPMMRPLRFADATQLGRGHEYNNTNNNNGNGDEYRRKPRNIFERIHPIRHYDGEGDRRFQYDEEDGLPTQNFRRTENYGRGSNRRPVDFRGPREERGNIRYNNSDRMFYSGPKQFGNMRDYAEEGIPRRVRP